MIIGVESVSQKTAVQASCLSACLAGVQASASLCSLPLEVDVKHRVLQLSIWPTPSLGQKRLCSELQWLVDKIEVVYNIQIKVFMHVLVLNYWMIKLLCIVVLSTEGGGTTAIREEFNTGTLESRCYYTLKKGVHMMPLISLLSKYIIRFSSHKIMGQARLANNSLL